MAKQTKEVVIKEPKAPKVKKQPKEKPVKTPKLFKKKYTEKQLEKKIYKKIFIEDDKKFIKSLIVQVGTKGKKEVPVFGIPTDKTVTKKDQKRLNEVAKSIKKQKGRIKFLPLIACVVFIFAVAALITSTKNVICRKIITNTCESIFEAKCDIGYLNLKFLDSSFTMKNFEIADKKEPMKDLFSIETVNFDFSFPQLLRAHFVAEDLSILGFELGKERKYSGALTEKHLAKIEKQKAKKAAKEQKKAENLAVMNSIKDKVAGVTNDQISELFTQYNPQSIIENCYAQLETPEVSKEVQAQVQKINEEWKATPEALTAKVESTKKSVNTAATYDFSQIKTEPAKIKQAIEVINKAISEVDSLKNETVKISETVKTQSQDVIALTEKLSKAVKHDKDLAQKEISKITSFKLSDSKKLLSGYFDKLGYTLMGKYYPYAYKVVNKLLEIKDNAPEKTVKIKKQKSKQKVTAGSRLDGRNVYFRGDTTPRFWIKKATASGLGMTAQAMNITTDMDAIGKPAQADFMMTKDGIGHNAKLTVDCRTKSTEPLINADYTCSSLPLALPASYFGGGPGVPGFDTKGKVNFNASIYNAEGFTLSGNGNFTDLIITAEPFEPAYAYSIYSSVLSKINAMTVGVTAGYTIDDGLIMKISTDADKKLGAALTSEMNTQLTALKTEAEKQLFAKITELSGGALGEISSFDNIKAKVNEASSSVDKLKAQLEAKKQEANNLLKEKVDSAKQQATDAAVNKLKDAFKR
ncbi:MAG: TIGR03545 family protein [Treponema sp.]|nr:TIGR03545 family protein [Treponema sp.]